MTRLLLVLLLLALPVKAEELAGPIRAEIVRVVDGDTLVVDARPWMGMIVRTHVRLRDVDAPEMSDWSCPAERRLAGQALEVVERMVDGVELLLLEIGPDKYAGRVVARVIAGGQDVGEVLLRKGLARPYGGGPRHRWCDE